MRLRSEPTGQSNPKKRTTTEGVAATAQIVALDSPVVLMAIHGERAPSGAQRGIATAAVCELTSFIDL
jgi:hypothetical protein